LSQHLYKEILTQAMKQGYLLMHIIFTLLAISGVKMPHSTE